MNVKFPAGLGVRFLSRLLDSLFFMLVGGIITYLIKGEFSIKWQEGRTWELIYTLYLTIVPVIWGGYIIGKRILKIKIKRMDNEKLTMKNMILREIVGFYLIGLVTFGIANVVSAFMIGFREDKRGIHDFIGGTYVGHN
ncbi:MULTISPECIES: RDD family protein [Bacillus]|uniref:RDD family protein n=1 Tax=Bacillus TaxID=1386 RepID=UPI0002FD77AE|nr:MULTISPECIES: RDD family protein [Bacillus]